MGKSANNKGMVLALVGESGAGKTTTTAILKTMGFAPVALSKHLRDTAIAKFGVPTRSQVQNLARETQVIEGDDYYARVAVDDPAFDSPGNVVVDGLRNLAELTYVTEATRKSGRDFFLMAVVTSDDNRFSRVVNRGRAGDPLDRSKFDADDARARGSATSGFQQNAILIEKAEYRIENSAELADLTRNIEQAVAYALNGRASKASG